MEEQGGSGVWPPHPSSPLPPAYMPGAVPPNAELLPLQPTPPQPAPPPPPRLIVDRPPGVPQVVQTSRTAISLQWSPVSCTVVSPVPVAIEFNVKYELQMQQVDDKSGLHPDRWSVQYLGTASFVQVKGLRPGRTYAARVTAVPHVTSQMVVEQLPSAPSDTQLVQTEPSEPMGQPAPQLASRLKKELKFKWAEPEETGGRPLDYVFQMAPAPEGWQLPPTPDGFYEVYHGPERSYLAKRLTPGVQYCGRVKAANCVGESAWSPLVAFYTQATVPSWDPHHDAPFVYDTSASSVTLGWPEPASNGGSVIGYELEMDDGGGFRHVARATERQCVVHGLHSGILYKFRVRAENEAGRSLWSPVGEGRTAAVAPGPCFQPTLLGASQTSLSIRWEGPEDDGGSPVVQYEVEVLPKCSAARRGLPDEWVAYQGPDQACTLGGLRAGCTYMVRVRAASRVGKGPFGSAAQLQTSPDSPECPGAPAAVSRHQTEMTVAWAPPEHDGGSRVSSYRLESCCLGSTEGRRGDASGKGKAQVDPPFELAYLGPDCTAVLSGLQPGHRFTLRCCAINDQGKSGWGPLGHAETLPGLPYPVETLQLVAAASSSLKLRWSQPFGQGAPVTSYVVEVAEAAALAAALQQQQQQQAQQQRQQLEEEEAEGHMNGSGGDAAQPAVSHQPNGTGAPPHQLPPLPPNAFADANGVGGAAGSSSAGSEPDIDSLFRPAYQGPDLACTVTGLEPHTEYAVRVRATNAVGASVSDPDTFRTAPAPPSCPLHTQQQGATPSSLHLSWQPPQADHGLPVTGYQLECARGTRPASAAWRLLYQGASMQAQVEGLDAGSRYLVRVRAGSACGWGPWCDPVSCATDPDCPAAPPSLTAKAVGTSVRAAWESPEDNGAPITAYLLELAQGGDGGSNDGSSGGGGGGSGVSWEEVFTGEATSYRLQQLQANTEYRLRVRAVNAVGAGPCSRVVTVQTTRAPPSPPVEVQAAPAVGGGGQLEVSWQAADQGDQQAAAISHEVEVAVGSAPVVRQSCPARSSSVLLSNLPAGTVVAVRVRSVGADGAGHGAWSPALRVSMPQQQRIEEAAASAAAAAAAPSSSGGSPESAPSKAQKRRERAAAVQQKKTAAAKAAPRKLNPYQAVDRWMRRSVGISMHHLLAGAAGLGVLCFALPPTLVVFLAVLIMFAVAALKFMSL